MPQPPALVDVAGPGNPAAGEKFALLIGVPEASFDPNERKYAEADVVALGSQFQDLLKVPADHIVFMTRQASAAISWRRMPTKANILEQLELLAAGLREQDTLIVAVAGQGVQLADADEPSFYPIDAKPSDPSTLIPLSSFRRPMERSRAGLKFLLVDAGRSDPLNRAPRVEARARPSARPADPSQVITFLSCSRGERAFEDPQSRHGIFFHYLIEGLRGPADLDQDGLGTVGEIQAYVYRNVRNFARDQYAALQQPELSGSVVPGEIFVALRPASVLLKRAKALYDQRKYEEVISVCTRLIQFDSRLPEAYHLRGNARILDSRESAAASLEDFTAAIRNSPRFTQAYFDRGRLLLELGELDQAIADFNEASRLGDSSRDLRFFRGRALLHREKFAEAVADLTEAIRLEPESADSHLNRGIAFFRLGRLKEALSDHERAIRLEPKMARAYLNRGVVRLKLDDLDGAITDFDVTIQQARRTNDVSTMASAYFDRGRAFYLKKDYERAIEDWERVARNLDDRDCMTLDFLGLAYAKIQNPFKATRYFEDAVRLDDTRTYAPAHAHLGDIRCQQKDYVSAIKECTTAIEIDPTFVEAYSTRSRAFKEMKQLDRASEDEKRVEQLRRRGSPTK
jgi:tetratricopeptide (TPR) repeat protein